MQKTEYRNADTVIVLDFETTGMSPDQGDRAIEIGAVKLQGGEVIDRFQGLMNPGRRVSSFIEGLTGISNDMLVEAPSCEVVMDEFADFIDGFDLVAHNASFDRRFLDAELASIGRSYAGEFACSMLAARMLAARRVYPAAPNHKLGTLVEYKCIANNGTFHRALADAEMTAGLWLGMLVDITTQHHLENIPFTVMQELGRVPATAAAGFLGRAAQRN
jgi:DNA polymerase-3 subunit epsilon